MTHSKYLITTWQVIISLITIKKSASFTTQNINWQSSWIIPNQLSSTTRNVPFYDNIVDKVSSLSKLSSVRSLIEDLTTTTNSQGQRIVFVGGKGGVGKTTISSSIAVTLASDFASDVKVLVVSSDPAHSLGDALDVNLKSASSRGRPIQMTDSLTNGRLYAMEVDTEAALERFQNALSTFDITKLSDALGVQPEMLNSLGLSEFAGLLNNPPPGLDELVALASILDDSVANDFDVIIVDTAPTGHTLRMLALPEFLDGFLVKLLELRMKLSGVGNMLQSFLGGGEAANTRAQTVDNALNKLEEFRSQMDTLQKTLKDSQKTDFVVVTIPTKLSVNESKRLMVELRNQGVKVANLVVNQCVVEEEAENKDAEEVNDAMINYYERRKSGQNKWIENLQDAIEEVSSSSQYKDNGGGQIQLTQSPFFDVELVGTPALAYLGQTVFGTNENFEYLMKDSDDDAKFIICGGKGGVGKTTTSSSLAVTMAANGHNVALISTDPAHSLGDAFSMDFSGGSMVDVPLIGVPPNDGSLSVLEVDPKKSLGDFKGLINKLIGSKQADPINDMESATSDIGKTLRDLGEVFNTLPAGTDEVVALAKVIGLIKQGSYDRIVLDTAPTGHCLRMLSTPGFIAELIDKVLKISERVNSNSMVKMMITSATGAEDLEETTQMARRALVDFQFQMYDLEDLICDSRQAEFFIVSLPTELAVRESVRLLNDLTFESPDMPIKVRNVIVNQVLKDDSSDVISFFKRLADGQKASISELRSVTALDITKVPYLDTEPRGVFGLKVLAEELIKEDQSVMSG